MLVYSFCHFTADVPTICYNIQKKCEHVGQIVIETASMVKSVPASWCHSSRTTDPLGQGDAEQDVASQFYNTGMKKSTSIFIIHRRWRQVVITKNMKRNPTTMSQQWAFIKTSQYKWRPLIWLLGFPVWNSQ